MFNAISQKTHEVGFFGVHVETDKLILKFTQKCKGPRITKRTLEKNDIAELTLPNFNIYYKATVIIAVWHCPKANKQINRTSQRVQKQTTSLQITDFLSKDSKTDQLRKDRYPPKN